MAQSKQIATVRAFTETHCKRNQLTCNRRQSRKMSYQQRQPFPRQCHWWTLFWWSAFGHPTSRYDAPPHRSPRLSHCRCRARWRRLCSCSTGCRCPHPGSRSDEHKEGTCATLQHKDQHRSDEDILFFLRDYILMDIAHLSLTKNTRDGVCRQQRYN